MKLVTVVKSCIVTIAYIILNIRS